MADWTILFCRTLWDPSSQNHSCEICSFIQHTVVTCEVFRKRPVLPQLLREMWFRSVWTYTLELTVLTVLCSLFPQRKRQAVTSSEWDPVEPSSRWLDMKWTGELNIVVLSVGILLGTGLAIQHDKAPDEEVAVPFCSTWPSAPQSLPSLPFEEFLLDVTYTSFHFRRTGGFRVTFSGDWHTISWSYLPNCAVFERLYACRKISRKKKHHSQRRDRGITAHSKWNFIPAIIFSLENVFPRYSYN